MSDSDGEEFVFEDEEDEYEDGSDGMDGMSEFGGTGGGSAVFGGIIQSKTKVKEETLTDDTLEERIRTAVHDVVSVLGWNYTPALLLLRHFKWNPVALKERFFEDYETVVKNSGVEDCPDAFAPTTSETTCCMCWDDFEPGKAFSLKCGHTCCQECWENHLRFSLKNKGASSIAVRCPMKNCGHFCGETAFASVFGAQSVELQRYRSFLRDIFSEEHPKIRQCPTPACGGFVSHPTVNKDQSNYFPVKCERCSNKFCFGCARDDHGPATCAHMKHWIKKEQDESETANWVTANTKPCPGPGCGKMIEKNGGCNHIVCQQCKYEWCWICEGEWAKHGSSWYKCNFFDEDSSKNKNRDEARTELERYIHYYTRYRVHEQSKKLDRVVLRRSRDRMAKALQNDASASLVDLDYLETTAQVLIACRHTLMFSYIYAFFLQKGREKDLFEFNQQQLEFNTELLSEFVEDKTGKYGKQEIVNRTSSANIMLRKLQEGCNMIDS